ncbi:MAG: class I SAM-dependent methyltransferase [Deltaproteobacteria bacterium]|nr:class I SAM-dependent methyltransferase [Deltaproteobacteria bacterium]
MAFQDHFSSLATDYARYRPRYPEALFRYLAGLAPRRSMAWDCATGSGQAALGLAEFFERVVATDASDAQLSRAEPHARVEYRAAPAEASGLAAASVDLVTVAQALHWFDLEKFYTEVRRVARPGGILAVWTYALFRCDRAVDAAIGDFYDGILGGYWTPERRLVEQGYRTLPFPFREGKPPEFAMEARWSPAQVLGYLGTWSALKRYREAQGRDPLPELAQKLHTVWGKEEVRTLRWPLFLRWGVVTEEGDS